MAELAKELLRSTVRAFYPTEHILVIDALILHHALNDQELAIVCGTQTKQLRKTCGRLREDGLLSVEQVQEKRPDSGYYGSFQQPGKERFTNRDWYYINFHHAIDSIKFKMYRLNKYFESLGMPTTERKDQSCPRCKSQYTDLEAMDDLDHTTGEFLCKRCGHVLEQVEEDERATENESMKRLNLQMETILQLMQKIDASTVPENDWETAYNVRRPIVRSDAAPAPNVEQVPQKVQSTKGMETKPEKIAVQVQDDEDVKREKAAAEAKEKKEREAKQNALPEWISKSTVNPGEQTAVGAKEEFERRQREANSAFVKEEASEEKKVKTADDDVMAEYWKELEREKAAEKAREAEEDEDEDDDDEFEDVDVTGGGSGTPANGITGNAATSTGMNTPMNVESSNATDDERETKRVRIEEPSSAVNGANHADTPAASDEDEDELEFENV